MSDAATQGHEFRAGFYHEDNGFNVSPSDSDLKPFGYNARVDRAEGSNNAVQVFEPGTRLPVDIVERNFRGSWSVSFIYTNPWWLDFFFGSPSTTDNGDGSYTHTYSGEDPRSQQIPIGREPSGKERVLTGCIAATASISPTVGGLAQVTIEGAYAEEDVRDPASIISQPSLNHDPMTYADAVLSIGGSVYGYVQQGSVQLQNTIELVDEWGSRVAIDFAPRQLVPTVNFSKINESGETANLETMYGGSTSVQSDIENREGATMTLDNGVSAGSGINKLDANMTDTFPNSYAEGGIGDPQADITEQIQRLMDGIDFDATNEVSTAR